MPVADRINPPKIEKINGLSKPAFITLLSELPIEPPLDASISAMLMGTKSMRSISRAVAATRTPSAPKAAAIRGKPKKPTLPIAAACPVNAISLNFPLKNTRLKTMPIAKTMTAARNQPSKKGISTSSPKSCRARPLITRAGIVKLNTNTLIIRDAEPSIMPKRTAITPRAITAKNGMVRFNIVAIDQAECTR